MIGFDGFQELHMIKEILLSNGKHINVTKLWHTTPLNVVTKLIYSTALQQLVKPSAVFGTHLPFFIQELTCTKVLYLGDPPQYYL